MAKPCVSQEVYPPKTCSATHVRQIKKSNLFYRAEIGFMKSTFPYYEEYVYPEGETSGDNIPTFGNESVERSFH